MPLRDLLRRNHDDRVQDYLAKMDQQNQDELMNTKTMDMGGNKGNMPKDVTPAQRKIIAEVKNLQRKPDDPYFQ